jgi:hypothetical protein
MDCNYSATTKQQQLNETKPALPIDQDFVQKQKTD